MAAAISRNDTDIGVISHDRDDCAGAKNGLTLNNGNHENELRNHMKASMTSTIASVFQSSAHNAEAPASLFRRRLHLRALSLLLCVPALGCAAGDISDDEIALEDENVAAQEAFLQNNNNFVNCGTAQKARIERAVQILSDRIYEDNGRKWRACLADAFIGHTASSERIAAQFHRAGVTTFTCTSSVHNDCADTRDWYGCASIGISGESITLANQLLNDPDRSDAYVAGVIAHELAHNYGYDHPGEPGANSFDYNASVPERARACAARNNVQPLADITEPISMSTSQSRTRKFPGEVALGYFGGMGGDPKERGCVNNFVDALRVRAGDEIDGFQVSCRNSSEFNSWVGGTGGTLAPASDTTCPAGEVLVGIRGRAGRLLDRLAMVCAPFSNLHDPALRTTLTTLADEDGGNRFESFCPAGKAVKRFRVRAGAKIDQIQLVCDDPNVVRPETAVVTGDVAGGTFDTEYSLRCNGNGALMGLWGKAGARIDRLSGLCRSTMRTGPALTVGDNETKHILAPVVGGSGGTAFATNCEPGELMVGVHVRSGSRLDAIAPMCAPVATWHRGSTSGLRSLHWEGGNGGTVERKQCPVGSFLVGFNAFAGGEVTGLQLACRDL